MYITLCDKCARKITSAYRLTKLFNKDKTAHECSLCHGRQTNQYKAMPKYYALYAKKGEENTMQEGIKIKAVIKRADGVPVSTNISNTLKNLQRTVGGYIETFTIPSGTGTMVVICNEEGRLRGLPYNCTIFGREFVGDIIVTGADLETGEFIDLPCTYQQLRNRMPELWED